MPIPISRDEDFRPAIKKIMDKLELIESNMELLVNSFDKVMKNKNLSHSQEISIHNKDHDHTKFIEKKVK